jgi:hypothetical protein
MSENLTWDVGLKIGVDTVCMGGCRMMLDGRTEPSALVITLKIELEKNYSKKC